ncbi:hypothetical protein I7I53_11505 [Histoplasma capsulatum var. duboisii H88]|uniref:Uncharacterized protein n=1 Tax=Ajellomyces capsulatus (strain H88) TaxID=544711 RepID=A0A8A1LFF6_AJEC8|nr:hypothetical protein I7I53_11505 [Histoplasma capsulatum var. duboisii H88]
MWIFFSPLGSSSSQTLATSPLLNDRRVSVLEKNTMDTMILIIRQRCTAMFSFTNSPSPASFLTHSHHFPFRVWRVRAMDE